FACTTAVAACSDDGKTNGMCGATGSDWKAPTNWIRADVTAARAAGAKHVFAIGHKPAYSAPAGSLDGLAKYPAARDLFWSALLAARDGRAHDDAKRGAGDRLLEDSPRDALGERLRLGRHERAGHEDHPRRLLRRQHANAIVELDAAHLGHHQVAEHRVVALV